MSSRLAVLTASLLFIALSIIPMSAQMSSIGDDPGRAMPPRSSAGEDWGPPGMVVSGVVLGANGTTGQNLRVELHDFATGKTVASAFTNTGGAFEFRNVPRGSYEVIALEGTSEARERVDANAGEYTVTLRMPGMAGDAGNSKTVSVAEMKVPGKARSEFRKAQDRLGKSQFDQAREAAVKAVQIYPPYADAHAMLGIIDLQEHKAPEATAELEKAVQLDPSSPFAFTALGACYNVLTRFDDALRALDTALRLSPTSWQAYFEMAKAYLGKGDFAASLRQADRAMEHSASHAYEPLHLVRAYALLGLKQYPKAITEFEEYLSHAPSGATTTEARQKLDQVKAFAAGDK